MKNVENLFNKTTGEIENLLKTRNVVAEAMTNEGNTLISLINIGFGFATGGGSWWRCR